MNFTGERYLPSLEWPQIAFEHWHRYCAAASLAEGKAVLDIACGVGYGSDLMSRRAASVVGVDVDAGTIAYAREKYRSQNLTFLTGNCGSIPIPGEAIFDLIVSFETIEHVDAPVQTLFLNEVKRLLKPDGVFLISTPNKPLYDDRPSAYGTFHRHELGPDEFKTMLSAQFNSIRLLGQKVYLGSVIWNLDDEVPGPWREFGLEFSGGEYRPATTDKEALYTLALCSNTAIAGGLQSILLDISDQAAAQIQHLEKHIQATESSIATLEQQRSLAASHTTGTALQELWAAHDQAETAWNAYRIDLETRLNRLQAEADQTAPAVARLRGIEESVSWRILTHVQRLVDPVVIPLLGWYHRLSRKPKGTLNPVAPPDPKPASAPTVPDPKPASPGHRILILDDAVPDSRLGSGFPRAHHMLKSLAELGYACTLFPLSDLRLPGSCTQELRDLSIEVFDGTEFTLDVLLAARSGLYDIVIISRPHNAARTMERVRHHFPKAWILYDAEAIYANREILRHEILGLPLETDARVRLLEEEVSWMRKADAVIAVSKKEQHTLERLGIGPVFVYGNPTQAHPTVTPFVQRDGLLFVGGFLIPGSPNEDAMLYFANEIFPRVRKEMPCRLIIAGTNQLASIRNLASDDIIVTGRIDDLRPYYEQARVFIVPSRFAAGIPQKLHEAMAHGLPAVVSPVIAEQMEQADGTSLLIGTDPQSFADRIITLYRDPDLWHRTRNQALDLVRTQCDPATLKTALQEILTAISIDESILPATVRRRFPVRGLPAERSLMVRLDLTNTCNLACRQCTLRQNRSYSGESAGEMDLDLFTHIADQVFPYAASVALSCEAEPLMHRRFLDIMKTVASHPGPLYKITTNGQLLDDTITAALFSGAVGEIYLSVDGATAATYESIRKQASFARLEEGICRLNRLKAERGAGRHDAPLLQVNYTLMTSTLHELPLMVERCRDWNIDRLVLQHVYGLEVNSLGRESLANSPAESDAILESCRARCADYGIRTLFPRPFDASSAWPDGPAPTCVDDPDGLDCPAPWRMVRVRWNGDVYPCDLWQRPAIGNLRSQSFTDIWNSTPYVRLRWDHARRRPWHPNCRACSTVTTENSEGRNIRAPIAYAPGEGVPA